MTYKNKRLRLLCSCICFASIISAQNAISGIVLDAKTSLPVEYVNIGVRGKDIGTVSDIAGRYTISIDKQFDQDSIVFSSIGYEAQTIRVEEYKNRISKEILLQQKIIILNDVFVIPSVFEEKILGNSYNSTKKMCGFKYNKEGFEVGVLLKIKKRAVLNKLTVNVAESSYDSIYYRLNVYKETKKKSFENILQQPIYVTCKIGKKKSTLDIDLSSYNLVISGNTLVTLEHVTDMGQEGIFFYAGLIKGSSCYYRKTSQGEWKRVHMKLGFNVTARVEK